MVNWYKNLYVGDTAKKKQKKWMRRIENKKAVPGVWLLTLPSNQQNNLDVIPADLAILGEKTAEVTLQEGRYHQIKRMFGCFGAKVVSLHRLAMGNLYLPVDLPEGECRELTAEELNRLQMHES